MPTKADLTLAVLREIPDELKGTNQRLDRVEQRLEGTNERLDRVEQGVEALEHRQTGSELRLASELIAVGKAVSDVRDLLRDRLDLRDRVDEHERRIASLERHAGD